MGFPHLPKLTFPFPLWTHCSHHLSSCCTCSSLAWFAHLWKTKLSPAYSEYFCLILFLCLLLTPRLPCACRDLSRAQFPPHLQWLSHPSSPPEPLNPCPSRVSCPWPNSSSTEQLASISNKDQKSRHSTRTFQRVYSALAGQLILWVTCYNFILSQWSQKEMKWQEPASNVNLIRLLNKLPEIKVTYF